MRITGDTEAVGGTRVTLQPQGALSDLLTVLPLSCVGCDDASGTLETQVDENGRYSFTMRGSDTQTRTGGMRTLIVRVLDQQPMPPGAVARGATSVAFDVRDEHVSLPTVDVWHAVPRVAVSGSRILAEIPAAPAGADASAPVLWLADGQNHVLQHVRTSGGHAGLDARVLEDLPGRVWITADEDGEPAAVTYFSAVAPVRGTLVPQSRGATCRTVPPLRGWPQAATCPLTDGDLLTPVEPLLTRLSCPVDGPCRPPQRSIEIDLGSVIVAHAIYLHGSDGHDTSVEVSRDGLHFRPVRLLRPDLPYETSVVRTAGKLGRISTVRIRASAASLSEVSVW